MTDSDHPEPGRYSEPQERLTRLAGVAMDAMMADPEWGEDLRGAFMVHDDQNGSGACLVGYPDGEETEFEAMADVVQHISVLFRSSGAVMELNTVPREGTDGNGRPGTPDGPRIVLTLSGAPVDPALRKVCDAVKEGVEATAGLDQARMIIIMGLGEETSALMHHGYESHHAMAHALFNAFQHVITEEGGRIAIIPVEPGTWN